MNAAQLSSITPGRHRVLLIEDELDLVRVLTDMLTAIGYQVNACNTGEQGVEVLRRDTFDLILLDVMLPGRNGFEICQILRQKEIHTPVLMLTARGELDSKVTGLNAGADDYLTKPFHPLELQARVEALIRRTERRTESPLASYEVSGVYFDFRNSQMVRRGQTIDLSERECRVLRCLIERRGRVVTREELLNEVWGYETTPLTRTVDVHIVWLRQKIEEDPRNPRFIITVHGLGYRFGG